MKNFKLNHKFKVLLGIMLLVISYGISGKETALEASGSTTGAKITGTTMVTL